MAAKKSSSESKTPTIFQKFASAQITTYDSSNTSEIMIEGELYRFATHPEARCMPQYLALKGIGWGTFKYWMKNSWRIKNAYEHTVAMLWCRWFDFIHDNKKLPAHHIKLAEKFLNVYDDNLIHILNEKTRAQAQASATQPVPATYKTENYQTLEIEEPYKSKYEEQERKRKEEE